MILENANLGLELVSGCKWSQSFTFCGVCMLMLLDKSML